MIESSLPQVAVLAYNEVVPEVTVEARWRMVIGVDRNG